MKKPSYLFIFSILISTVYFSSCEKEIDTGAVQRAKDNLEKSYQYYPIAIGKSWTYHIDSIYYSDNLGNIEIDTIRGLYRETIVDTFKNSSDNVIYRVLKEKLENNIWFVTRVYSLMPTTNQLIRTEDNTQLIDLIFPLKINSTWNPTALIDANSTYLVRGKGIQIFKDWPSAYISDILEEEVFGEVREVLKIQDVKPDDNIILYQSSTRSYASGVGMISKEQAFFTTQKTELAEKPWEEKAEIGFKCIQTLVDYK